MSEIPTFVLSEQGYPTFSSSQQKWRSREEWRWVQEQYSTQLWTGSRKGVNHLYCPITHSAKLSGHLTDTGKQNCPWQMKSPRSFHQKATKSMQKSPFLGARTWNRKQEMPFSSGVIVTETAALILPIVTSLNLFAFWNINTQNIQFHWSYSIPVIMLAVSLEVVRREIYYCISRVTTVKV